MIRLALPCCLNEQKEEIIRLVADTIRTTAWRELSSEECGRLARRRVLQQYNDAMNAKDTPTYHRAFLNYRLAWERNHDWDSTSTRYLHTRLRFI